LNQARADGSRVRGSQPQNIAARQARGRPTGFLEINNAITERRRGNRNSAGCSSRPPYAVVWWIRRPLVPVQRAVEKLFGVQAGRVAWGTVEILVRGFRDRHPGTVRVSLTERGCGAHMGHCVARPGGRTGRIPQWSQPQPAETEDGTLVSSANPRHHRRKRGGEEIIKLHGGLKNRNAELAAME